MPPELEYIFQNLTATGVLILVLLLIYRGDLWTKGSVLVLREQYEERIKTIREENDQQTALLCQIMDERQQRYQASLESLQTSAGIEAEVASIIRLLAEK